ncbi:MAG: hypothetical protein SF029_24490 [bacterium]|nr:hypothetical protein [bacterium]
MTHRITITIRPIHALLVGLMLLGLCIIVAHFAPALIDLLPLADRQNVVMQAAALNLPETTAAALGHLQFALFTTAVVLLGFALLVNRNRRWTEYLLDHPALPLSLLAMGLLLWYAFERSIVIDGTRLFYLDDDAMITMRYARNLADGLGPVWNPGERVEGYTNFLWMLVMAVVHLTGLPEATTSLAVIVINGTLFAGTLWLVQESLRALNVGRLWRLLACLALACDVNMLHWASSGLETHLLALLVAVCAWALMTERERPFLLALALIPLVRSDAPVLAAAFGLVYLGKYGSPSTPRPPSPSGRRGRVSFLNPSPLEEGGRTSSLGVRANRPASVNSELHQLPIRRALRNVMIAALPAIAHLAFRLAYYGDLLPNTYYLKMTGIDDRPLIGLSYALRLVHLYPLGLLAVVLAVFMERKLRFIAFVWLVQITYVIYAGGDTFWLLRPFVGIVPLLYLATGVVLSQLTAPPRLASTGWRMGESPLSAVAFRSGNNLGVVIKLACAAVFVFSVPVLANGGVLFANPQQEQALFGGQVQTIAAMIEANVPTDVLISLEPAGSIPYFAQDHRFVDALGKSDAHIARLPAHPGNTLIGHNKFDWDYVYHTRQPDLVIASCVLPDLWIPLPDNVRATVYAEAGVNGLAYLPYQLLHPDFVNLYYPNRVAYLVPSPTQDWILCPFAREGSSIPLVWILPGAVQERVRLDFDAPVAGRGWYPPDVWDDGRTVQWTGPGTTSTLYLPFAPEAPYTLELCVIPIQDAVLNSLRLRLNGQALEAQPGTHPDCNGVYVELAGEAVEQRFTTLTIQLGATVVPDSFSDNGNTRSLGLAFDWVRVALRGGA